MLRIVGVAPTDRIGRMTDEEAARLEVARTGRLGAEAQEGRGVALGKSLLDGRPVGVPLVRLADRSPVERSVAADPRHEAWGTPAGAKRRQLDVELGHAVESGPVGRIGLCAFRRLGA